MTQITSLLCILCCALGLAKAEKFEINTSTLAIAWQSSVYEGLKKCFRDSANNTGHGWLYFHTSHTPDSSGYQWLLLKLNSGIRVLSVTVHGRKEVPGRAHNIEILLGARLPNGMKAAGTCRHKLKDRLDDFIVCGRTKSDNANWIHEVKCNTSICTRIVQYVLIRKYVQNEADKYMNFVNLQVEKVPKNMTFYACSSGGGNLKCNSTGLRSLVPGNTIIVKVCSHCQPIVKDQSNCSLFSSDGTKKIYDMENSGHRILDAEKSCLMILNLKFDIQNHGRQFQCDLRLESGEIFSGSEPVGFVEPNRHQKLSLETNDAFITSVQPRDASIHLTNEELLVVGKNVSVTFVTDYAIPKPAHKCWLINSNVQPKPVSPQGHPLTLLNQSEDNNGSFTKVKSNFALYVDYSIEGKSISCQYEINGQIFEKSKRLPTLLYPCQTSFSMPQSSSWIDGSTNLVTVNSSVNNRLSTSQTCFLETNNKNMSLVAISSTNTSSTFSMNVTRQWSKSASIVCLVNQSGIIETWTRQLLPSVLYKASNLTIRLHSAMMRENSTTEFTVESSDAGNPTVEYKCSINGRDLRFPAQSASPQKSQLWRFKPQSTDDKQNISCQAIQILNGTTIFSQTIYSSSLNVHYRASNIWKITPQRIVKEGDLLSIEVTSTGGNPVPSHQCWLDGSLVSSIKIKSAQNTRPVLVTNFSLIVPGQIDRVYLTCNVTQEGHTSENFNPILSVFNSAKDLKILNLPVSVYEDTNVIFTVSSAIGNSPAKYNCHVPYGKMFNTSSYLTRDRYQTDIIYTPDRRDTRVECTSVQMHTSNILFSQSVFQNITVLYASHTKMIVSPHNPITEGSTVNVTLISSGGKPTVSSFKCWIGDTELEINDSIRASNSTSVIFFFNATRNHNLLLLKGKFKQDEQLITWHNASLLVYSPAKKPNKVEMPHTLRANSTVEFKLHVTDSGNPPAKYFCYVSGRNIGMLKQTPSADGLSLWSFIPSVSDNNRLIICHIVQTDSSGISVYNQTVSSEPLNVLYPSINSWSATELQEVKEGELLSVSVTSVGGNPAPSHQCWMQSAEEKQILQNVGSGDNSRLVSNFSLTSTRHMNRGSLMCEVTQQGQPDMTQQFSQHVSVFYTSTDLSALSCNGTHLIGGIFAADSNPPLVSMNCSVSTAVSTTPEVFAMWNRTELTRSKGAFLRLTPIEIVNPGLLKVFCKHVQENYASPISHIREIKCIILSKDEDAAANSRANTDSLVKWTIGAVLMLGIIIAVPVTVYVWRRTGNSIPQGQGDTCRAPSGISMKQFRAAERDPNTVYYYAEN